LNRRVVITGLGLVTPVGIGVEQTWQSLCAGKSGVGEITRFDASKFKTRFACEVKNFEPTDYFDRKEARKLDLYSMFGLVSADQAVKDAGFNMETLNKDRVGVIYGSGIGGIVTFMQEVKAFVEGDGTPRFNPFFIPKMISDIAAGHISMRYGFRGPNFATVSACATSTNAIIDALYQIRLGKADVMVSGGSEAPINEPSVGGFSSMQALSSRNDDFKTASRPFDKDRDGFVIGEGAGTLILEELEHAKKRGAKIYAELVGGGMSADAHHLTAPHPEGEGAALVMKNVLDDAGMKPEDIDYINVHGTATPLGDISETKAIKKVFEEQTYNLNISSTKSMTGHLLGAAGAVEAIASLMAVINDIVPPTINNFNRDPELDPKLNLTLNKYEKRTVNAALSNTFGFGGHNMSVIFKKYTE